MKEKFTVKFAGLPIGIEAKSEYMRKFCRDYLTEEKPLFSVSTTDEMIEREISAADFPVPVHYAESLCLYREIAERIPAYGRVVFHGAAIKYNGKAYVFTAPSGVGKSTHIKLWHHHLGEKVEIINGDKPIIQYIDGAFTVWSSPFAGKEGWQKNTSAPLGGICRISRGVENSICEMPSTDRFTTLYLQTYKPSTMECAKETVNIVSELCRTSCFSLSCNISEDAVKTSFEALTNEKY